MVRQVSVLRKISYHPAIEFKRWEPVTISINTETTYTRQLDYCFDSWSIRRSDWLEMK